MQRMLKEYKYLMKTDKDLIMMIGRDYVIQDLYASDDEYLFLPRDAILNKHLADVFSAEKATEFMALLDQAKDANRSLPRQISYSLCIEGEDRHFVGHAFLESCEGTDQYFIIIIREEIDSHFYDFIKLNHDLMCIVDLSGHFVRVNEAWEHVLGYSSSDLTDQCYLDFVNPEDHELTSQAFVRLLDQGEIHHFINRYRRSTGEWRWLEWNSLVKNGLAYGIARDITEQMSIEAQLKAGEANFRSFFDTIDDMIIIARTDGNIIYANTAMLRKLGYTLDELDKIHVLDLHPPHMRKEAQALFSDMLIGNQSLCQLPVQGRQGQVIPAETKVWLGNWNGSSCIFALTKDMSSIHEAHKAVEQMSKIQSILMELATQFINLPLSKIDNQIKKSLALMGDCVEADRVYIFDYDFERETTSNTYEWCRGHTSPQIDFLQNVPLSDVSAWLANHLAGQMILIEKMEEYHDDDETKAILEAQGIKSLLTVPMMQESKCLGFVGFDSVHDYHVYSSDEIKLLKLFAHMLTSVRSRESQERQLKESLDEKTLLMKEIHHRVKNNLQIVSSLLFLQSHFIDDNETRKVLLESEARIKAMAALHENFYQTNGLAGFNFKKYVIGIIQQIVAQYDNIRNIQLACNIDDICLDPDKAILCGLIINELLANAFQHAFSDHKKGQIKIEMKEQQKEISLIVQDNGFGMKMDAANQKKSFGMILIDSLVKQLQGSITTQSNCSLGTVISISFARERK